MTRLSSASANVCSNPIRMFWQVQKRIKQAMASAQMVGGQEISKVTKGKTKKPYMTIWKNQAAAKGKKTYGTSQEVPISVPKGWKVHSARVVTVHGGKAKVSPARYYTKVLCEPVPGLKLCIINVHPVSKPRQGVPSASWRIQKWGAYWGRINGEVDALYEKGWNTLLMGDWNKTRAKIPSFHPAQKVLVSSGYDIQYLVPAKGWKVSNIHTRIIPKDKKMGMDHPIVVASYDLNKI